MAAKKNLKTKDLSRVNLLDKKFTNSDGYYTHELSVKAVVKQTRDLTDPNDVKTYDPKSVIRLALRPLDLDGNVKNGVKNYVDKDGKPASFAVPMGDEVDVPLDYAKDLVNALLDFSKKYEADPSKLFQIPEAA